MKALFLLTLCALSFATTQDPYLVESKVQADLDKMLSRIIRKDRYLIQVNVEISTHPTKRLFEGETTIAATPPVHRRPATEITAGFVPEPELKVVPPQKEERQVYRFNETPKVDAIRVQIQVDEKLPENVLNQARALANAYLSGNYPDLGSLRVTEVTMLQPEWWEAAGNPFHWLGWLGSACLLVLLALRRRSTLAPAPAPVSVNVEMPKPEAPALAPVPVAEPSQAPDESRKKMLHQIVSHSESFRGYYTRLNSDQRLELWTLLHGPAFESVLERLSLPAPKTAPDEEVKKERVEWHEKNLNEFIEAAGWQHRQIFGFLSQLTDEQLVTLAGHESPKTVCLMLRFLKPAQAAAILDNFSQEKRLEILSHVGALKASSFAELSQIEAKVRSSITQLPAHFFGMEKEDTAFWGLVLNESKVQDKLVEALEQTQADLLPHLKKLKFKLEEAAQLDVAILDKVFNDVENDLLSLALVSCDAETLKIFLQSMSEKRRELVEQQIAGARAASKESVQAARHGLTNKFREAIAG